MQEFVAVKSLLGTDLYKINMGQVMFLKHPELWGEYHFKNRTKGVVFTPEMVSEINHQIDLLCKLRFTNEELEYLKSIRFLRIEYIEYLRLWHPIRDYITVDLIDGELSIVVKGPMYQCMQFEIYVLEIVNETYFRYQYNYDELLADARMRLDRKIEMFKTGRYTFKFSEFGARRRLSREWQAEVIGKLVESGICNGTSNVELAKEYNIYPVGTFAHEFVQMYQGISKLPLAYTNYYALKDWFDVYNGDNGIALTDTLSTDLFLLDFNFLQASVYKGVRHDSGDPFVWGDKIINHYLKLGIDPKTKTLLFSDGLDFDRAQEIHDYFKDKINVVFGIGTYISNDTFAGSLNIVMKLQYVNGKPVAKISDVEGKTMCDDLEYLTHLKNSVKYRIEKEGR